MQEVQVSVEKIKQIIQVNRDKHKEVFEKAWEAYQAKMLEVLQDTLNDMHKGKKMGTDIDPLILHRFPVPTDHTDDYDRILAMLDMETRDEIILDQAEFTQYIQDNWSWTHQWSTANSTYLN